MQSVCLPNHDKMPELEDVRPLASVLAARLASGRAHELDDLVQVGLIAYHRDAARLQWRFTGGRPWALARTILQRAMWKHLSRQRRDPVTQAVAHIGADQAASPVDALAAPAPDDAGLHDYYDAVERTLGPLARTIAENLVAPRGTCADRIWAIEQRKRRRRKHYDPHGPRFRLSQELVRQALGIGPREWVRQLAAVRRVTVTWLRG